MDTTLQSLSLLIGTLVILSMAVERCVEVIKGFIPWLGVANKDLKTERIRQSIVQGIAIIVSCIAVFLTKDAIYKVLPYWDDIQKLIILSVFISGGAGVWNSIAAFILALKNAEKAITEQK
jgi:hypothetical protein